MKVFVYVSHWHNGVAFEGDVVGRAFTTMVEAKLEMAADRGQAIEMISHEYGGYYDDGKKNYAIVGDSDEFQNDWWEGKIFEQEI